MKSAPSALAFSQNAPNLISRLQSTSGLGVRLALYSSIILSTTPFLYSFSRSKKRNGISSAMATLMASRRSSRQVQGMNGGCQALIKTPVTSKPRSLSSAALTAESTPPDKPTKTLGLNACPVASFALLSGDVFLFFDDMFIEGPRIVHVAVITGQEIKIRRSGRIQGRRDAFQAGIVDGTLGQTVPFVRTHFRIDLEWHADFQALPENIGNHLPVRLSLDFRLDKRSHDDNLLERFAGRLHFRHDRENLSDEIVPQKPDGG